MKKYEFENIKVKQNSSEEELYDKLINEFYRFANMFLDTGNAKKESMLKIIRQIQLLIKASSLPQSFREYKSNEAPSKFNKICDMLEALESEKVAIGSIFKDSISFYTRKLKEKYPNRPLYVITGEISFKKRLQMIKDYESTQNGILLCTQQSLRSSVNIPTVDHIIAESMQWNMPKIMQWAFRFIRYNSKNFKKIYLLSTENTIEENILALLIRKEQLNEFVKTLNFQDESSVFEEYGVDVGILDTLMTRKIDDEGKMKLEWGKQKIA